VVRVLRIVAHVPKEQRRDNIRRRTTGSRMSTAGSRGGRDRVDPQLIGDSRKHLHRGRVHFINLPKTVGSAGKKEIQKKGAQRDPKTLELGIWPLHWEGNK